ncbi:hypothetical protein [Nitrincola sp. A-D6]|uniref:hypothetical protein n=1 Tax=Nitrincola sp. A-D6 TaxID=1545442 RepID=UPI00118560CC|nr:hypothetical protein [Nitrincola sp. A-D6]
MNIGLYITGFVFIAVFAAMVLRQRFHRRLRQELSPSREPVTELPDLAPLDCQTVRFATQRGECWRVGGWLMQKRKAR